MSVYVAARDLANVPLGKHQFLIIVNTTNPYPPARLGGDVVYAQDLGKGTMGYVVGAQNRGDLVVEYFEASDTRATLEYFDRSVVKWYQADFDTEVAPVAFKKTDAATGVTRVFELIDNFALNQELDPIRYPTAGLGYNSNSWAQTVIELAGGTVKSSNMKGWDVSNGKRIPKTYFEAVCTVRPRPVLNR
jgi:hypothetical protein